MSTLSKRFVMSINNNPDEEFKSDTLIHDSNIPYGIIDYVKVNKSIKSFLRDLKLQNLTGQVIKND